MPCEDLWHLCGDSADGIWTSTFRNGTTEKGNDDDDKAVSQRRCRHLRPQRRWYPWSLEQRQRTTEIASNAERSSERERGYEYMMRVFMQHFISLLHKFIKFKTSKISSAITFILIWLLQRPERCHRSRKINATPKKSNERFHSRRMEKLWIYPNFNVVDGVDAAAVPIAASFNGGHDNALVKFIGWICQYILCTKKIHTNSSILHAQLKKGRSESGMGGHRSECMTRWDEEIYVSPWRTCDVACCKQRNSKFARTHLEASDVGKKKPAWRDTKWFVSAGAWLVAVLLLTLNSRVIALIWVKTIKQIYYSFIVFHLSL